MTTGFEYLQQGKFFESVMQPFIDIFGIYGSTTVFTFFLGMFSLLIYIKTKSIEMVGMSFMVLGSIAFFYIYSPTKVYFLFVIIAGAAMAIYNLVYRKRVME